MFKIIIDVSRLVANNTHCLSSIIGREKKVIISYRTGWKKWSCIPIVIKIICCGCRGGKRSCNKNIELWTTKWCKWPSVTAKPVTDPVGYWVRCMSYKFIRKNIFCSNCSNFPMPSLQTCSWILQGFSLSRLLSRLNIYTCLAPYCMPSFKDVNRAHTNDASVRVTNNRPLSFICQNHVTTPTTTKIVIWKSFWWKK